MMIGRFLIVAHPNRSIAGRPMVVLVLLSGNGAWTESCTWKKKKTPLGFYHEGLSIINMFQCYVKQNNKENMVRNFSESTFKCPLESHSCWC